MANRIEENGKMYWAEGQVTLMVLVPKRRGKGFLKCPVGHHSNWLSDFVDSMGIDCVGLDGYLSLETGWTQGNRADTDDYINKLSEFLNKEPVEVSQNSLLDWLLFGRA